MLMCSLYCTRQLTKVNSNLNKIIEFLPSEGREQTENIITALIDGTVMKKSFKFDALKEQVKIR
jgi:hypothetical protein